MIVRIVKMEFEPAKVYDFLTLFKKSEELIKNFKGCNKLQLLQDVSNNNIFFTYSYWDSEKDLDNYRSSEVFKTIWKQTSSMFIQKASAWSTTIVNENSI